MNKSTPSKRARLSKNRSPSEQLRVRHGKLSERTVSELLFFAFTTGMDGSLSCSYQGITKTLRFKAGKLTEAKSNDPHDSSEWILHEMGKLKDGFATGKNGKAPDHTLRLLSEQIRSGIMQPNEIDEFMHRRVRRILHDLMSWEHGEYVLELTRKPRPESTLKVHRSIPEMILREMKTAPNPAGLSKLLTNPGTPIEQVPNTGAIQAIIKLTAIEQRVLRAVGTANDIRDIVRREGLGFEAASRILLGLEAVGLVRILRPKQKSTPVEKKPKSKPVRKAVPKPAVTTKPAKPKSSETADESDEFDLMLADDGIHNLDTSSFTTDAQVRKYLLEILHLGLKWDPYTVLGLDSHCKDEEIEDRYQSMTSKIFAFQKFSSGETLEYLSSALNLLEESRTILLQKSLRRKFDSIYSIVDVGKKIRAADLEHKKSIQAFKEKRIPLAIVHLKFAIFLDPRNSDFQYKLIYMMAQNRRLWKMARLLYDQALNTFGTNAHILALSGHLYHKAGDKIRARMEYTKALKIDPEQGLARQGMAILDRMKR